MANIQPFRAIVPRIDRIASNDEFFAIQKERYPVELRARRYKKERKAAFYVYRQVNVKDAFNGIICGTDISEYQDKNIKIHEQTLTYKERIQIELSKIRQAQIKPILLTYPGVPQIERFIAHKIEMSEPDYEIRFRGTFYKFWRVSKTQEIKELTTLFAEKVPHAYLADGHHRAAVAMKRYKAEGKNNPALKYLFTAYLADDQIKINDYNRVITSLNGLTPYQFLKALKLCAHVKNGQPAEKPKSQETMSMFMDNQWFSLKWKKPAIAGFKKLNEKTDVHLLNELVLKNILKIADIRNSSLINYVDGTKGIPGIIGRVPLGTERIGFMLHPISVKEFMAISDEGLTLPPKSTYIQPRLVNGMINFGY